MANGSIRKTWEWIRRTKRAYQLTFPRNGQAQQIVLQDLARFCRANETVFNTDQRLTDVLIGRNEVWKRIQDYLNLSSEDLYQLRTGQQLNLKEDDE